MFTQQDFLDIYLGHIPSAVAARRRSYADISRALVDDMSTTVPIIMKEPNPRAGFANYQQAINATRLARLAAVDAQVVSENARSPNLKTVLGAVQQRRVIADARKEAIVDVASGKLRSDWTSTTAGVVGVSAQSSAMLLPDFTIINEFFERSTMMFTTMVKLGSTVYIVYAKLDGTDKLRPEVGTGNCVFNLVVGKKTGMTEAAIRSNKNSAIRWYATESLSVK